MKSADDYFVSSLDDLAERAVELQDYAQEEGMVAVLHKLGEAASRLEAAAEAARQYQDGTLTRRER